MFRMECEISYSNFSRAARNASKAASECREYANELERKVSRKISDLRLGQTGNTSRASYFISQKKRSLNDLAARYDSFSRKIEQTSEYAEDTDKKVASYIKTEGRTFRKDHGMSSGFFDGFAEILTRFANGILDSTALGRWIKKGLVSFREALNRFWQDFKYWYFCDGGKYWVKLGLAVAGVVLAVVALIAAWPVAASAVAAGWTLKTALSTVAALATAIMAVIAVADSTVSVIQNAMAVFAFKNDPGWAERHSSITTLSDFLHKTNFNSKIGNILSEMGAFVIDVTTVCCAVVTVVNSVKNLGKFFTNSYRKGANWKRHFDTKTTKYGKFSIKRTWESFKTNMKGIDYAFKDKALIQKQGMLKRTSKFYKNFSKFSKDSVFLKTLKKTNSIVKKMTKQLESPKPAVEKPIDIVKNELDSAVDKAIDSVKNKLHFNEVEDVYNKGKKVVDTDYGYKKHMQSPSNPTPAPAAP